MKFVSKKLIVVLAAMIIAVPVTGAAWGRSPKYVFFFLGDGMAASQIQATEAYLTTINGGSAMNAEDLLMPKNRLNMSKMPVAGIQTTYDSYALMTDSASSATAFGSGLKTKSGTIGMDPALTTSYKSVAELALEQGRKVGVISSVSLDHATPAAYYAKVPNRGYMNNIATQMATSGYHFFGGGGLVCPTSACRAGDTDNDVWALLEESGYTVLNDYDAIMALHDAPMDKVVAINPYLQDSSAMPYAIDKPDTNLSLAEMTDVAISVLSAKDCGRWHHCKRDNGFFLMVEGGKIDWACHANDAKAAIGDMLDFDDAVAVALDFYYAHPYETLIVVTGDHETGGMTIGHATTAYSAYYEKLVPQTMSFTEFGLTDLAAHKAAYGDGYDWTDPENLAGNMDMLDLMWQDFGLDYFALNAYQQEKLEDAYDMTMSDVNDNSADENKLLYGSYDPLTVTTTHILNEIASVGWTSYSHTGVPVPLFAEGVGAEAFSGFYDNTDIAKKVARVMGVRTPLPVAE